MGGGGRVGMVTHCGEAAVGCRGALTSTRVDEEEMGRVVEEAEAIAVELLTGNSHSSFG